MLSTLSISVTTEGVLFYDNVPDEGVYGSEDWKNKTLPLLPPEYTMAEKARHEDAAPAFPPGLPPIAPAHIYEGRRHSPGLVTPPPTHSFDAPRSILTDTFSSAV